MRVCLAGEGAIGRRHLSALDRIEGVQVVSLAGGDGAAAAELAQQHGIDHVSTDLAESLARPDIDAVILATPTPLHSQQMVDVLRAGKHCLVEIPMADSLAGAEKVVRVSEKTDLVAMVCHTRRFNPSHQWVRRQIATGRLRLQHLVVETFFLRRTNTNALGRPRSWTDHLLWHHACHTVDLFQYQVDEVADRVVALQGPLHPELGIAMDMSIGLTAPSGAVCTLALSFNNHGPFGTSFRYICDQDTYVARYDDLVDGRGEIIDLSGIRGADGVTSKDGIELQDREFFAAIATGREPNASVRQCLEAMRTLGRLERALSFGDRVN